MLVKISLHSGISALLGACWPLFSLQKLDHSSYPIAQMLLDTAVLAIAWEQLQGSGVRRTEAANCDATFCACSICVRPARLVQSPSYTGQGSVVHTVGARSDWGLSCRLLVTMLVQADFSTDDVWHLCCAARCEMG